MSKRIKLIKIEDVFEGNVNQFKDCFFNNVNEKTIKYWCEINNFKYEIIYE